MWGKGSEFWDNEPLPSTSLKHKNKWKIYRNFTNTCISLPINDSKSKYFISSIYFNLIEHICFVSFLCMFTILKCIHHLPTWMFIFLLFFHVYGIRNCLLLIYSFIYMYDLINFLLKIKKFTVTCKSWNFRWKSKEFIFSSFLQLLVIIFLSLLCMNEALNLFY